MREDFLSATRHVVKNFDRREHGMSDEYREHNSEGEPERASEGDVEAHKLEKASEGRASEGRASEGRSSEGEPSGEGDDVEAHVLHPKTSEG
jgi:hypothetical protein